MCLLAFLLEQSIELLSKPTCNMFAAASTVCCCISSRASPLLQQSRLFVLCKQVGFFNIVGIPLFKAMADVFEGMQPMLEAVQANCRYWETATAAESAA